MKRLSGARTRRKSKRLKLSPVPSIRLKLIFAILSLGLMGLLGRTFWLQVFQSRVLEAHAREFQTEKKRPLGTRRSILDRRGRLVALDEERYRLWAHPRYFQFPGDVSGIRRTPEEVAKKLSQLLSTSTDEILLDLGDRSSGVKLAENLNQEIAHEIRKLRISGIDLEAYPQRIYPQGALFANVVGFLDIDRRPQAGLELSLDKHLLREEKASILRRGADGTPLPDDIQPGVLNMDHLNLHLTLDTRLQEVATKELAAQVKRWDATKGVVIVMDITNGELLALASTPSYNPNSYWNYSPILFKEWSVQDLFEPGSTFKPINLALALEEGVIDPQGKVNDNGIVNVGGWSLSNWDRKPNGILDFAEVLQVSSNVGMVKIMQKLNPTDYWEWLRKLGLDDKPQTDLPGAVPGQLKAKEIFVKQPIEPAVAAFGQGFSITPLKLAQLHALIANGGKLVTPHITRGLIGDDQEYSPPLEEGRQVLSPEVTNTVLGWMETVVEKGSGQSAQVPGYRIGGKTGTAQKSKNGKSYSSKICSFVASLPIEKPRYVVLVVVDEPQKPYAYGSTVAVPVAKKVIESLLVIEKIPPSAKNNTFLSMKD